MSEEELRWAEAVATAQAKVKNLGGFIQFDGNDYCENCRGWDGRDRRCECGNRRVGWVWDDEKQYLYPEVW